jgi:hypothetical protein
MIILANDPGIINFGIAVIDTDLVKVLYSGFHSATINHLSDNLLQKKKLTYPNFLQQTQNYLRVCQFHLKAWQPNLIVHERYQTRNFKGINIELINIMIGLFSGLAYTYGIPTRVISSSAWKNTLRGAGIDLLQLYQDYNILGIPPHLVDSLLIASFVGSGGNRKLWTQTLPHYLKQLTPVL